MLVKYIRYINIIYTLFHHDINLMIIRSIVVDVIFDYIRYRYIMSLDGIST